MMLELEADGAPARSSAPVERTDADRRDVVEKAERVRDALPAAFLYGTIARVLPGLDIEAFKAYRDGLIEDIAPDDRLEEMLLEQVAAAHLTSLALQYRAAGSDATVAGVYMNAAIKLAGEARRTILAVGEYRETCARLARDGARTDRVLADGARAPGRGDPARANHDNKVGGQDGRRADATRRIPA